MKIRLVGTELLHAESRRDMTGLIVDFGILWRRLKVGAWLAQSVK
jgi:hypothetical protein